MAETSDRLLSEDDIGTDTEYIPHRVIDFNAKYLKPQTSEKLVEKIRRKSSECFTARNIKNCFLSNVPIIGNLRKYKIRQYLLSDILSGITVGIMQIPQGMAFGLLTTLPPICGLYTALFGPLTYFFLGTSRHLSIGAVAVVSLMLSSVIDVGMQENNFYDITPPANQTNMSTESEDDVINQRKIEIATSVSFVSGLILILLGKLRFGLISTYMSEQLVGGFTAAVATHILTSQAKHVLGITVPRHNGIFKLVKTWIDVFKNIPSTNPAALITTVVCLIILYLVKVQVNMRYKAKLKMPIPIELIMIAITTVISHFAAFNHRFDVTILKDIPPGLPAPSLPNPVLATNHIADAFIIGMVAFAQSVSGARLLARKHNYKINPNQELVAYGGGSVVSSIFSGYINAGSLSRTMVLDGTNGKSQIASLVGCVIVLTMIVAVGPLVYSLPKCVLSAIIIINLRTMFLQFLEIPSLWRISKYDFVIWIVTFLTSTVLDADIGFAVSLVFSILTVSVRTQRALFGSLGYVDTTGHMKMADKYDKVVEPEGIKIVQFQAPIYFANADIFVKSVIKSTGIDPSIVKKKRKKYNQNDETEREIEMQGKSTVNGEIELAAEDNKMTDSFTDGLKIIILDLSGVNFLDVVGVKTLRRVYADYLSIDVEVYLTHCNDNVVSMLTSTDFLKDHDDSVYLTINCVLRHIEKSLP